VPKPETGIDQNGIFIQDILDTLDDSIPGTGLNIAKIDSFCTIS